MMIMAIVVVIMMAVWVVGDSEGGRCFLKASDLQGAGRWSATGSHLRYSGRGPPLLALPLPLLPPLLALLVQRHAQADASRQRGARQRGRPGAPEAPPWPEATHIPTAAHRNYWGD